MTSYRTGENVGKLKRNAKDLLCPPGEGGSERLRLQLFGRNTIFAALYPVSYTVVVAHYSNANRGRNSRAAFIKGAEGG